MSSWTRGALKRNWDVTPLGMTAPAGWSRGHLFRGGFSTLRAPAHIPALDPSNPRTWVLRQPRFT